jgi:DNA mismatch endonuclease, patch repair protein
MIGGQYSHAREKTLTPPASSEQVRRRMQATRQRGTEAEVRLCEAVRNLGLRFRIDQPILATVRSRADLLFPLAKLAVFVDGCFWHGCPQHGTSPKTNRVWWMTKLKANRKRDARNNRALRKAGWTVVRIWEHAALESPERAARSIATHVERKLEER